MLMKKKYKNYRYNNILIFIYNEEELIHFEIRKIGSGSSSKNQNDEINRLRKENQELRAQLEKFGAGSEKEKPQPFVMKLPHQLSKECLFH